MFGRHRNARGSAAMEFILTFPLIMFLAVGIVEFGWCFHTYNQVYSALRDAARQGAKAAGGNVNTGASEAESQLQSVLTDFYAHCASASCTYGSTTEPDGVSDSFLLEVDVPYTSLTGIPFPGLPNNLHADIVFAIQP